MNGFQIFGIKVIYNGKKQGYNQGHTDGYVKGKEEGHREGKDEGYKLAEKIDGLYSIARTVAGQRKFMRDLGLIRN